MKRKGKIVFCLACGLVLAASVQAQNPYIPIVARNVFGLNPPKPGGDETQQKKDPPPKITVSGIMSIVGHAPQAIFKVATPGRPGVPPKDTGYILALGQQQDEVEVTQIDEKGGTVTFNNHGVVQQIALNSTAAAGGTAPASTPKTMPTAAITANPTAPPNSRNTAAATSFGSRFGRTRGAGNTGNTAGAGDNSGFRDVPTRNGIYTPQAPNNLSGDDQAVIIAAQTRILQDQGSPIAHLMPPTKYDDEAGVKR